MSSLKNASAVPKKQDVFKSDDEEDASEDEQQPKLEKQGNADDDDEEDDDGETESDEEEEDYEPQLKYQRLGGSLNQIFGKEGGNFASALAVGEKFLALGTHLGYLYILDFEGNSNNQQEFRPHSESINDLSIDESGEFVASVSNDGKVIVHNLYTYESSEWRYNRPVKTVAIEPDYAKKTDHGVCFGGKDGNLLLNRPKAGLLGSLFGASHKVIHKDEGEIHSVRWKGSYIAWGNDKGVKIYDVGTQQGISSIKRSAHTRADMYRCCLVWVHQDDMKTTAGGTSLLTQQQQQQQQVVLGEHDEKLIIGWGTSVQVVLVKERKLGVGGIGVSTAQQITSKKYVEVIAMFEVDFFICGLCPFLDTPNLLVLAYDDPQEDASNPQSKTAQKQKKLVSPRPELRILNPKGGELSCDALSIKDYQTYFATDYRLEYSRQDKAFYILSQRDIVVAKKRDVDDHIKWLVQRERYPEALACAKENEKQLKIHSVVKLGQAYLDYLLEHKEFKQAAQLVPTVAGSNKDLWEKSIYSFMEHHQFHEIIPKIPTQNPRLSETIYEMKLNFYLMHDHEQFLACVKQWPKDLYQHANIITAVTEYMNKKMQEYKQAVTSQPNSSNGDWMTQWTQQHTTLLTALAELYLHESLFDKALGIYLKLKRPDVFDFIQQHQLFASVQDRVLLLLEEFDEEKALDMLIQNTERMSVDQVVEQLNPKKHYLLKYLHALFKKNDRACIKYHDRQVELYAELDTAMLEWFLEQSQSFNIEQALRVCQEHVVTHENDPVKKKHIYRGIVYLLGRMGNTNEALLLIIDKLQDVDLAIHFVESQKDSELWQELIKHSLNNAHFISGLLDHISEYIADHIDPMTLIQQIPPNMQIPNLKYKLAHIISDYSLQMTLQTGCKNIMEADTKELAQDMCKMQRQGVRVNANAKCVLCNQILKPFKDEDAIIFLECAHAFHVHCYKPKMPVTADSEDDAEEKKSSRGTQQRPAHHPFSQPVHCLLCHKKDDAHDNSDTQSTTSVPMKKRKK